MKLHASAANAALNFLLADGQDVYLVTLRSERSLPG